MNAPEAVQLSNISGVKVDVGLSVAELSVAGLSVVASYRIFYIKINIKLSNHYCLVTILIFSSFQFKLTNT